VDSTADFTVIADSDSTRASPTMTPQPQLSHPSPVSPAPPPGAYPEATDEISLRELFDIAWSGKWIIAAVTAVATILGTAHALLATPVYQANALVQVEANRGQMLGFERLAASQGNQFTMADTEIEILRSRLVLGQVVEELDLQTVVEPERFPIVGAFFARRHGGGEPAPPRFGASGYAWGGETLTVDRLEVAGGQGFVLEAGESGRYKLLNAAGDVVVEGRVGELAQSSEVDPAVSIFVSELVARPDTRFRVARRSWLSTINSLRAGLSIRERGSYTGILELSLEGHDPEHLQEVLDGLAQTYVRQHVERRSAEAKQSIAFLEQQLPELRAELEAAEDAFNQFRRDNQAVDLSADTQHLLQQIVQVEAELAQLELKRLEESQRFAAQHPQMQMLAQQQGRLRATKADLERRVEALPGREQEVLRLRREVEVATELYTSLLNTFQELRVVQAGTIGNVRILDTAARPEWPIKPRRPLIGAMSMMLGMMLGLGVVFARHALRRTVHDPDALEHALALPVYSVIPHSRLEARATRRARRRGGRSLLAQHHPQDPAIEGLRSFRTSLHFALLKADEKVIAVTSPHASSGKSFMCMNAGYVFAETGKRVLVIDGDLRRGYLHEYLSRGRSPGLSEVLSGQVTAEEAISSVPAGEGHEGTLHLLSTGALPPNPSELLMSAQLEALLEDLRERYDLIIVDTPPILAVTDAAVVAARAGAMFMLVRAGRSQLKEVEAAVKRLRQNDIAVTGLLFNDLGARQGGYGSYRYGHYQYQYATRHER
jgi:tyrosine-protein kinase Etk/Wzc